MTEQIILVYGSYAKNESNEFSDIDVLVVTENGEETLPAGIFEKSNIDVNRLDIKYMDVRTFKMLIKINSLYIHHLKECDMFITGRETFNNLTSNLKAYEIKDKQVNDLCSLAEDSLASIEINGVNLLDLSVLFTFLRNAIILVNYSNSILEFNKLKLLDRYEKLKLNKPRISEGYMLCYDAKIKFNRGFTRASIKNRWNVRISDQIKSFISFFKEGSWR